MKTTTVRFPPELDKALAEYAKREDISKNQAMKKAVKLLLAKTSKESEVKTDERSRVP